MGHEDGQASTYHRFDIRMRHGIEFVELQLMFRSDIDICAFVLRTITVFGCREDGDTSTVMLHLISFHSNLMTPDYGFQSIVLAESLGDIGSELQADASLAGPSTRHRLWVGPEHLHHQACLPWLSLFVSVEFSDVVQRDFVV